jgi:hypothetical protein
MRYRNSFLTSLADLLSQCVYTVFCTCFPQSYMTHFNDDFRDFICKTVHTWINGTKPIQKSFKTWNLDEIDPPEAVFARKVLKHENSSAAKTDSFNDDLLSNLGEKKTPSVKFRENNKNLDSIQKSFRESHIVGYN